MNRPSRSTRTLAGATMVPGRRGFDSLRHWIVIGGIVAAAALVGVAGAQGGLVGSLAAGRYVADPGATLTVALRLESLGSTWTAAPTFESPAGWDLVWAPVPVELASAAPAVVLATLRVDPAAAAGDHPIAFEVHDPRSGRRHRFEGVVAVPAVHAVIVAATEAPTTVVDGAYEAHFVLRNVGNVPMDVRLDARATFGFDAVVRPARAVLPIGGVLPIVVGVRSPAAWNRTETVVVTLTTHADGAAPATARSATEVLAQPSSWAGAWQLLPLTLRFSVEVRSHGAARSQLELRGAGAADDRGLGQLSVLYKAPIDDPLTPDAVRLSYRRASWALTVGDVALSRAGFGDVLKGRGAAAEGRWALPAGGRIDTTVGVVGAAAGAAVGADVRLAVGRGTVAATGLLTGDEALFAVRATHVGAVPAVGLGAALVSGTVAYAVGARRPEDGGAWTMGHAAEARVALGSALGRLELGQSIVTAPFAGTAVHRAATDLRVIMRTGAWWPDGPMAPPTWSARYVAVRTWGDAAPAATVHEATWLVASSFGGLRVALGHVAGWGDGPQKRVSHVEGSASLGRGVAIAQRLEWRHATATEPVARLGWRSDVAGPVGAGRWSVRLEADATVDPWTLDDVHLRATWSTPVVEAIDARIEADWRPLADRSNVALGAELDVDLGRGRTLELGVAAAWHRTGPTSLAASAAFTVPLSVPVSRRSDVGVVQGRLVDGEGAPVAGATLRLGGAAAVTDGDGRFALAGAPVGIGAIVADRSTLPYAHPVWTASAVTVRAGAVTEVSLRVAAGGAVDGQLRFVAGDDALPGVDERAAARWWTGATVTLSRDGVARSATVGADGAFRLGPLEPGTWLVVVDGAPPNEDAMVVAGTSVTVVADAVAALVLEVRPVHRRVRFQDEAVPTLRIAPP